MPGSPAATFTVIGEALIDLSAPAADGSCVARPGGSPLNVAIGLAGLRQSTTFAGRLADDPLGIVLRQYLERAAVDLRYAVRAPEPTTVALVELSDGQATYHFSQGGADFQWTAAELAFLPGASQAVHFGSLASWLPPGDAPIGAAIAGLRRDGSVLISYDPNVRPGLLPDPAAARRQVEQSVSLAHVVKASMDDLAWLYGAQPAEQVARRWLDLGAVLVVLTDGADGSSAFTADLAPVRRPAFPVQLVDTVGAGDGFMSGLLDALARRDLLDPARLAGKVEAGLLAGLLTEAGLVAGITCGRAGARPPGRDELDELARRLVADQG